jgi:hypothetical protein
MNSLFKKSIATMLVVLACVGMPMANAMNGNRPGNQNEEISISSKITRYNIALLGGLGFLLYERRPIADFVYSCGNAAYEHPIKAIILGVPAALGTVMLAGVAKEVAVRIIDPIADAVLAGYDMGGKLLSFFWNLPNIIKSEAEIAYNTRSSATHTKNNKLTRDQIIRHFTDNPNTKAGLDGCKRMTINNNFYEYNESTNKLRVYDSSQAIYVEVRA